MPAEVVSSAASREKSRRYCWDSAMIFGSLPFGFLVAGDHDGGSERGDCVQVGDPLFPFGFTGLGGHHVHHRAPNPRHPRKTPGPDPNPLNPWFWDPPRHRSGSEKRTRDRCSYDFRMPVSASPIFVPVHLQRRHREALTRDLCRIRLVLVEGRNHKRKRTL
jgi:hypothetical protein